MRTGQLYATHRKAGAGIDRGRIRSLSANARTRGKTHRERTIAKRLLHARQRAVAAVQAGSIRRRDVLWGAAIVPGSGSGGGRDRAGAEDPGRLRLPNNFGSAQAAAL